MSEVFSQSEKETEPLSWLAFRYISGEMNDREHSDFESRLDPESPLFELAACEAVARAVRLHDVITDAVPAGSGESSHAAYSTPVVLPVSGYDEQAVDQRRRDVHARRISLLTSVAGMAAVGWLLTASGPDVLNDVADRRSQSAKTHVDEAAELVHFWADTKSDLMPLTDELPLAAADSPDMLSTDVPDWLLAALQSREGVSGMIESGLPEPEVLEN